MIHLFRSKNGEFSYAEVGKNGEYLGGAGSETFKSRVGVYKNIRAKLKECYGIETGFLYIQDDSRDQSRRLQLRIDSMFAPAHMVSAKLRPRYTPSKKSRKSKHPTPNQLASIGESALD